MPDKKRDKTGNINDYLSCVREMTHHDAVRSMRGYNQHAGVDCLRHCLNVSYRSFLICRRLGLDYRSAARGGLLHDFFLYDWHVENPYGGLHGFRHPKIAALNANRHFSLNNKEQDVIKKHMWPLTVSMPKYLETLVVILVDKFCCVSESASAFKLFRRSQNFYLEETYQNI
ncbi:HD family phosphohydrolase [Oscillospiraceae bacterium CM]|nr:HD family phosphohydrolase [Oscillospiraceae bacterium CM]